mgnify:CR=1 FL=1
MDATSNKPPNAEQLLRGLVRDVPDFPKAGIIYKDITPLLASRRGLAASLDLLARAHAHQEIDIVVGIESRGFIFGAALAARLGAGFVPARKPGKLPAATRTQKYALEYGHDTLEMHEDAITAGERVLICDDLIATGGTANATGQLVEQLGGELVGYSFVIELAFLNGRKQLNGANIHSLIQYD